MKDLNVEACPLYKILPKQQNSTSLSLGEAQDHYLEIAGGIFIKLQISSIFYLNGGRDIKLKNLQSGG